jgi:tetratricopeptide (TPR) repeat protein
MVVLAVALAVAAIFAGSRFAAARRLQAEMAAVRDEMAAGRFALAQVQLSRLVLEHPDEPEFAYLLGRCEAARGRLPEAMKSWRLVPPDSTFGGAAALDLARAALSLGFLSEAEATLKAGARPPTAERPQMRRMLLILIGQQGRVAEAQRLIEEEWHSSPLSGASSFADRLAMVREHVGLDFEPFPLQYNLGQLEREAPSKRDEDQKSLALARAYLATRSGDFAVAKAELTTCLERWPDDPRVWKAWLDWSVAANQVELARKALGHVRIEDTDETEIIKLRAWLARAENDAATERRALEDLVQIDPAQLPALSRLAELARQAGQLGDAEALTKRQTEVNAAIDRYNRLYREDKFSEHLEELGGLAEKLGRSFEARAFWELARIQSPASPDAARALARLGKRPVPSHRASSGTLADLLTSSGERGHSGKTNGALKASGAPSAGTIPTFEDRASAAGLSAFVLDNGQSPIHQLPEMSCGGVGLLDFDGDGRLDVFAVQGGPFPPGLAPERSGDRLYRNNGDGTFTDASARSRLASFARGYGHGIAVGDYDNDGHPDIFLTRWRSYALYRNRGDGTFEDLTKAIGLGGDRDWPTSAAFADLDNDGDLDLYVCHYGTWDTANPRVCKDPSGAFTIACDPRSIASLPDHVFRNDGSRFVDVTAEAGIVDRDGRGLGVVASDLDGDGKIDLFVANDSTANFLFRNLGGFRFEEVGHAAGVAANALGGYQAGMGIACGDLDGDGRADLAVTNFYGESTSFFQNLGQGAFADHTAAIGLAAPSRFVLGFGAAFLDTNNDGRLDLMTANGHVSDTRPLFPYAMPPQLYLGSNDGRLTEVSAQAGPPFQESYVGRGLSVGDIDNDGRLDAVMVAQNGPLVYFHNATDRSAWNFIMFQLEGVKSNRDGVGANITILAGGHRQYRERLGGGSFQSAADPRLHFGLGPQSRVESVEVRWPSGKVDHFGPLDAGRLYHATEGASSLRAISGP